MRRYFLTGCTGWFGASIVSELLRRADTEHICLLTREARVSVDERVSYWQGDILESPFPERPYTHIIHGANGSHFTEPMRCYYEIVEGTRRIMAWADRKDCEVLYLSSGAVFRDTPYGRGKHLAERLLLFRARIARLYTLIGPNTPQHYAVGDFIAQASTKGYVSVQGGAGVYRSYLHVDDAARWALKVLDEGDPSKPYDIGGDEPWAVLSVAVVVASIFGVPLETVDGPEFCDSYLPDVAATKRLGVKSTITLTQALESIRDDYRLRNSNLETSAAA